MKVKDRKPTHAVPAPSQERRNVSDPRQPGLFVRHHASGKTYAHVWRDDKGMNHTITLGRHGPEWSLADAREAVRRMRARIRLGLEPREAPPDVAGLTVRELVERYVASRRGLSEKTLEGMRSYAARLGPLRDAPTLKRADLEEFLRGIAPVAANRALRLVRSAFRWGIGGELVSRDPTLGLSFNPEEGGHRCLSDDEVVALWTRGDAFARFLILTGARRTEAALARWDEFDGLDWHVPGGHAKNGQARTVYLCQATRDVLGEPGDGPVFPATYRATPDRAVKRLRRSTGVDFRFHDLRVTHATGLATCGASPWVVASALGHSGAAVAAAGLAPAVTAVYDKAKRETEVRAAATAWAARILALVSGREPARVVAFGR